MIHKCCDININPKIVVLVCTAKRPTYDIAQVSETTKPIKMKFQDNFGQLINRLSDFGEILCGEAE